MAEHLLENKAWTPGALAWAELAVNQSQNHHTQNKNSGHLTVEEHAKVLKDDNPSTCCRGRALEVSFFADIMHVNVTVYCDILTMLISVLGIRNVAYV